MVQVGQNRLYSAPIYLFKHVLTRRYWNGLQVNIIDRLEENQSDLLSEDQNVGILRRFATGEDLLCFTTGGYVLKPMNLITYILTEIWDLRK